MKKIIIFLLVIMLFGSLFVLADSEVPFKIISCRVRDGVDNTLASSVISVEFNLRIDPEIKNVTVNGTDELIDKILLKEGKILEIYLKESIKKEKEYRISLASVKEIYESRTLSSPTVTFKTKDSGQIVSELIFGGTYITTIKNCSNTAQNITVVITAKQGDSIKALKVITQEVASGAEKEFSHTFTDIAGEYNIFAYGFLDMGELVIIDK